MKKLANSCSLVLLFLGGMLVPTIGASKPELDVSPEAWETMLDLQIINDVLDLHHELHRDSRYPEDWIELREFAKSLPKLFRQRIPAEDAWGNGFFTQAVDDDLVVASPGPNGVFDGDFGVSDELSLPFDDADIQADDIVLVVGDGVLNGPRTPRDRLYHTMSDIRSIGTAVEAYSIDHNLYPLQDQPLTPLGQVKEFLEPIYIRTAPIADGWGNDLIYWSDGRSYIIVSPGADGVFDQSYGAGSATMEYKGTYDDLNTDMIFADGSFAQWPEGQAH